MSRCSRPFWAKKKAPPKKEKPVPVHVKKETPVMRFFKDDLTYIGIGIASAPCIVKYALGWNGDTLGEKVLSETAFAGGIVITSYSILKNFPRIEKFISDTTSWAHSEYEGRKSGRMWWKRYREYIDKMQGLFEGDGIVDDKYVELIEETRAAKDIRKATKIADKLCHMWNGYLDDLRSISKQEKLEVVHASRVQPPGPVDERFLLMPSKSYSNLSSNQRLRTEFFLNESGELLGDGKRNELLSDIRKSGWYKRGMDDMNTYKFR